MRTPIYLLHSLALVFLLNCFAIRGQAADDTHGIAGSEPDSSLGSLQLIGGDLYRGTFGETTKAEGSGVLAWHCPAFQSDIVVPWSMVERISQPLAKQHEMEANSGSSNNNLFIVELQSGESLSGEIIQLDEQMMELDCKRFGKQRIAVDSVRSVLRSSPMTDSDSGSTLRNLDWKQSMPVIQVGGRGNWFENLGAYDTETSGTVISQFAMVPDLAAMDIQVNWQSTTPNWLLTLGDPRRLEMHVRKLENRSTLSITILTEDENTADIASAQLPIDGLNSISLQILCDSNRGRLVLMHKGAPIANLKLNKEVRLTGRQRVSITNNAVGRFSLRELRIYRSIFSAPALPAAKDSAEAAVSKMPETLLKSGETFLGFPKEFDPSSRTFGFATDSLNLGRISLDQVDRIEFPVRTDAPPKQASDPDPTPFYAVALWSGERFVGQSVAMNEGHLELSLSQSKTKVRIPLHEIDSVGQVGAKRVSTAEGTDAVNAGLAMRLVTPWAVSSGMIESSTGLVGSDQKRSRSLLWKPLRAVGSIVLSPELTGSIEPEGKLDKPVKPKAISSFGRTLEANEPSLFLTSGDCFSADILGLDMDQLSFQSSHFGAKKIPASSVRGIRKLAYTGTDSMEKNGRRRLLTLPRSQRSNPPTHLLVSREGDAIRGQLRSMDIDTATVDVRGEERKVLLKNVAEIIWLQEAPEVVPPGTLPMDGQAESKTTIANREGAFGDLLCQAIDASGMRISIAPERVEGSMVFGQHPELGECQIDLATITKLVLGKEKSEDAKRSRFSKWRLQNAPDPKFVNDLDSADDQGGQPKDTAQAGMIGKAAADFELKKLDGSLLKLSDLKGRIVVLDFWATWCGPCVASLPKITEIGQQYKGADVDVIAINIEQSSAEIKALLDRLAISPLVVMDTDGAVARAYQAEAIPQTVIIDRNGKVTHVFVGGGGNTEAKIRDALDSSLDLKL